MNEKFLFDTVIKKYNNTREIEYLRKMSLTGLEDYEELVIDEYCKEPGKALIIGCGAGRESLAIARKNISVIAIDIVEKLINLSSKIAAKKSIKANFLTMNALNLGFKKKSFDYIILLGQIISLIPFRKNRIKTLKECRRVLKDKGKLIITTHSREKNITEKIRWKGINYLRKLLNYLFPGKFLEEGDKWVVAISGYKLSREKIFMHLYTPEEAIEDMKISKLEVINVRSSIEILNRKICPAIRKSDKYIVYIAQKLI